jgi:hypothetical protein
VAAAKETFLETDAGVFDAGDNAVWTDTNEGDDRWPPEFDFSPEAPPAGAKFVISEFIGAGSWAVDDAGDAEFKVEKERVFKRGEDARRKAAAVERGPEPIARPGEVTTSGRGVEARINTSKKDDEVFSDEIRDAIIVRCAELSFGRFPGAGQ